MKWILPGHSIQIKAVLKEKNEPQKLQPTKFSMLIKEKNKKINFCLYRSRVKFMIGHRKLLQHSLPIANPLELFIQSTKGYYTCAFYRQTKSLLLQQNKMLTVATVYQQDAKLLSAPFDSYDQPQDFFIVLKASAAFYQ